MGEPLPIPSFAVPRDNVGRALFRLAQGFALVGGVILALLAAMSTLSIAMRGVGLKPITGDFELVQLGLAVAVSLFLPYCQMRRGHVIVDFFTAHASAKVRGGLDALGALALAAVAALIAWRLMPGLASVWSTQETTMILGMPVWFAYAPMVPAFALLAATGLYTAAVEFVRAR